MVAIAKRRTQPPAVVMAPKVPCGRFGHGAKRASENFILKVGSINCFQSILFLFRADFRAEGGRSVSQSERKKILVSFAVPQQRYFRVQKKLASARRGGAFTAQIFTPNLLLIYSVFTQFAFRRKTSCC